MAYYLYRELPPGADPLGPENKLIFALRPLVGTSAVGRSRNAVGALSLLSGGIGLSQAGESWGMLDGGT
ncbi:MAG: aldehyde ferredoxin oxidoreductase N-terminal domain-containing protein [Moorellales bacterium]